MKLSPAFLRLSSFGPGHFRVLLALLVVFSHMSFLEIGRPAVFVFFMLSGYWVLRMYDEKYHPKASVWIFYLSRFMRIWLAFATAFILVFLLYGLLSEPKPSEMLWGLLLFGIASNKLDVLGTSWSLDIELQFYLMVPLLSFLLAWSKREAGRLPILVVLVGFLTLLGWYLQLSYDVWSVFSYLPVFGIGALIWHYKPVVSMRGALASVMVFLVVGLIVAALPYTQPLMLRDVAGPFHEDWFGMGWVALLIPFVIWNLSQKSGVFDMHLGNYSYALYITHWPVIAFMRPYLHPMTMSDRLLVLCLIMLISIGFYLTVDRMWEKVRRKTIATLSDG